MEFGAIPLRFICEKLAFPAADNDIISMKRIRTTSFLTGMTAILLQAGLFRELSSFAGSSGLLVTVLLFGWLLSAAIGSGLGRRLYRDGKGRDPTLVLGLVSILYLPLSRGLGFIVFRHIGNAVPIYLLVPFFLLVLLPPALLAGWSFSYLARQSREPRIVYGMEGIGAFVGGLVTLATIGGGSMIFPPVLVGGILTGVRSKGWRWFFLPITIIIALMIFVFPVNRLQNGYFPDAEILKRRELQSGRAFIAEMGGERYLYVNSELRGTSGDSLYSQLWVYPALAQYNGGRVLLSGGWTSGIVKEAGRICHDGIVYHASDAGELNLLRTYFPKRSPDMEFSTGSLVRAMGDGDLGMIILAPDFPSDIHSAMMYSLKSIESMKKKLRPDGILAIYLSVGQNSLTAGELLFTSSLFRTMEAVFNDVQVVRLSGTVLVIARPDGADMQLHQAIVDMPMPDGLYYSRADILSEMDSIRQQFFMADINRGKGRVIRGSIGYLMGLSRFLRLSDINIPTERLASLPETLGRTALRVGGIFLLWTLFTLRRKTVRLAFISGFWAMGTEIFLLLLFHQCYGNLYYVFGLLSGLFLLGGASAALAGDRPGLRRIPFLGMAAISITGILLTWFTWLIPFAALLLPLAGVCTGSVFAGLLAEGEKAPEKIYASDLAGGLAGAIVFGLVPDHGLLSLLLLFTAMLCLVWKSGIRR